MTDPLRFGGKIYVVREQGWGSMDLLQLHTVVVDGHTVVTACGEVDRSDADLLVDHAMTTAQRHGPDLILDASGIVFLDCAGLGALVRIRNQLLARGGHLTLAGVPSRVAKILRLGGLDHAFPRHNSLEEALAKRRG